VDRRPGNRCRDLDRRHRRHRARCDPEAFHSVYEKEIAGWGELFRWLSYEKIGTSTIQSRATAGVAGGTYLFALPGSPGACRDAWEGILVHQLDNRFRPCNFVELMPRLQEHLKG
jgi:molybdenum cofactor biosynthesis protein B